MRAFLNNLTENLFAEKMRFALWLPVLMGFGIGLYFLLLSEPPVWITIVVVELLLVLLYMWRYNPLKYAIVGCLLLIAFGFSNIQIRSIYQSKHIQYPKEAKEVTYLKGQILKIDKSVKGKIRLLLDNVSDFDNTKKGLFRITLNAKKIKLVEGECVEMVATIMPPMSPVLPDAYQFNRKAFYEGISAIGYANSTVYKIDCDTDLSISQKISLLINHMRKKIVSNIYEKLPDSQASVVSAILAGNRDGISQDQYQKYRDSGLAHFLSISGLHMSLVAALAFFAIRLIMSLIPQLALKYDSKQVASIFAIFISFVYLLISGGEIPAQRAFIMTMVVLLGVLFSRNAISIRMLAIAAFIVLTISPFALISASFQMSFAAVLVLIAFYEKFYSPIQHFFKGKNIISILFAYIVGLIISDFIASLATLPFAIYHFNTIAIYTTLGNLLAGPIIGFVIMPFILISLVLMPFNLYLLPLKVVGFGVETVNNITAYVGSLPNAGYRVASMPFIGLLLIVVGGLWICIWQRKWRLWGFVPIILGILSIGTTRIPDFIYSSDGKTVAVKDNYENLVVIPFKKNDFIKQIWLEKTASKDITEKQANKLKKIYRGKIVDTTWLDVVCNNKQCTYKNRIIWDNEGLLTVDNKKVDLKESCGGIIYLNKNDTELKKIRSSIGYRLWN